MNSQTERLKASYPLDHFWSISQWIAAGDRGCSGLVRLFGLKHQL